MLNFFSLYSLSKQSITHPDYINHVKPCDFTDACSLSHILDDYFDNEDDDESDNSFVPGDSDVESFSDESSDEEEDHDYEENENQRTIFEAKTPVARGRSKGKTSKRKSLSSMTTRRTEKVGDEYISFILNLLVINNWELLGVVKL